MSIGTNQTHRVVKHSGSTEECQADDLIPIDTPTSRNELNTIHVIHERTHAPLHAHPDAHMPSHVCPLSRSICDGLADLVRSHVEDRVDAARQYRTVGGVGVAVAAKLPALSDPLGDRIRQLQLGMVKHSLQGKLQGHSTFVVVSAKYGVVDLDRAVCRAERPRPLLTVLGGATHGIRFAAVGALCPVHVLRPEAGKKTG